jgi:signal transduction histidine kinase
MMDKASLVKLRDQLDAAIISETPEAYAGLAPSLTEALRQLGQTSPSPSAPGDELGQALRALEEAWLKGYGPTAPLPGVSLENQAKLSRLLTDVLAVQAFTLSLAKGDLSPALKATGAMAGGLKSLQASLRHLTWQTQMIAKGDFSQQVEFMGEFSESFNAMTRNLAAAREELRRHGEELARANASLTAEIAERRRAEKLIQNLNCQLKQKVADLEAANQDMEAFSYSVSHDLRAPLRAIGGYARMLRQEHSNRLDTESLRLVTEISSNAQLMGKLIEDILAFARLGRQEIRKTPIDMTALIHTIFAELKGWEGARQVHLSLEDLPPAQGDRNLIQQVLVNLLTNALKFTNPKADAAIILKGWNAGNENIYSVTDNGVGFDMKYVDKLFNVFQRLHLSSEFEGTGVGLAIVQKIIQRHGGRVWAEGQVNEGAAFYFSLPRAEANT